MSRWVLFFRFVERRAGVPGGWFGSKHVTKITNVLWIVRMGQLMLTVYCAGPKIGSPRNALLSPFPERGIFSHRTRAVDFLYAEEMHWSLRSQNDCEASVGEFSRAKPRP